MDDPPLITVITATLNSARYMARMLESLATQTYRNFELVIQDARSADGTLGIIDSFRDRLPCTKVVSEKDSGIYDAWNRALERVAGEWVLFLGSDDRLASPDVFEKVATALESAGPEILFGSGGLVYIQLDGGVRNEVKGRSAGVGAIIHRDFPVPHPALFTRAGLLKEERFDPSFKIAGDYDFLVRTYRGDQTYMTLDVVVTLMQIGGISSDPIHARTARNEQFRVLHRHYGLRAACLAYAIVAKCQFVTRLRARFPVLNRIRPVK